MQAAVEARYPSSSYSYPDLKELVLDGCKLKQITEQDKEFLSTFQSLTFLSCSGTGLTTIQHLPHLPNLKKLELLDNLLTSSDGHLDVLATATPHLQVLRLGGNRLKSLDQLIKDLAALPALEVLDVEMNLFNTANAAPVEPGYRELLFNGLPQLKLLDGRDRAGCEVNDEDEDDEEEDLDDEEDDAADEEDDDPRATLKAFYEKDYTAEDDTDDNDFNPLECEPEEDDDIIDEDDDEEDDEEDDQAEEGDDEELKGADRFGETDSTPEAHHQEMEDNDDGNGLSATCEGTAHPSHGALTGKRLPPPLVSSAVSTAEALAAENGDVEFKKQRL